MPSYLITGVNRGIGWAFLRQISNDANNIVVGTVRNKAAVEKKISDELAGRSNVHIVEVEMTSYDSIKNSVDAVSEITGGKLDYIIANAAYVSDWAPYDPIGKLGEAPKQLEEDLLNCFKVNVIGNVHLFNTYMPLVLKGNAKKVITITSGMADIDLINQYRVDAGAPYAISKGAMNIAVSKFHAQYAEDGVLFMGICPGLVDTGHNDNLSQNQLEKAMRMAAKFEQYAPGRAQPRAPEDSVRDVMKVIDDSSLENGRGGAYISHLGSKRWL
ncbi:short-chain dehydrogenase [Colletotrichum somersetense]|nr:short-chain dehydrogenase [Colletotrichum somersetense]